MSSAQPRGPVDSSRVPRYAGPATFARLPRLDEVGSAVSSLFSSEGMAGR